MVSWLQLSATWVMLGVIWSVQLVQYPLFARVDPAQFGPYHQAHVKRISLLVVPVMVVEALAAVVELYQAPSSTLVLAFALLVVAWASTFLVQVRLHRQLESGWNARTVRRLIVSNWVRTVAWSIRALLLIAAASDASS